MYHSVSIRFAGGTLLRGGTCVVLGRFDARARPGRARGARHGAGAHHHLHGSGRPAPAARRRAAWPTPLDALRLLVHAGSPCPAALKRRALERVGPGVLWEFYGSTEGQFTVCSPEEWLARPGTVGRARPGRTLTVDEDGTIWCRRPRFARFTLLAGRGQDRVGLAGRCLHRRRPRAARRTATSSSTAAATT